jgi:heme/copper-type cytochrome/quinol oxidase subunit 2
VLLAALAIMTLFAVYGSLFTFQHGPMTPLVRKALKVKAIMLLGYMTVAFLIVLALFVIALFEFREIRRKEAEARRDILRSMSSRGGAPPVQP